MTRPPLAARALLAALPLLAAAATAKPALGPPRATLSWDVTDAHTGRPLPCKIILTGHGRTPSVAFTTDDVGLPIPGGALLEHDRILSISGRGTVEIPAGTYDVVVSHGPEWDLARYPALDAFGPTTLRAALHHVVDATGWISADLHVHADRSFDSRVPMTDRIYEFVADDVQLITATDHDALADYGPIIAALGVGARITSLIGDEITTPDWGHFGAFPLPPRFLFATGSLAPTAAQDPVALFGDVRRGAPDAILDLHHPRFQPGIGYFDLARFDRERARFDRAGASLDADAIEILNGYQASDPAALDPLLADWFSLLRHGRLLTATGNSDTHHLTGNIGGYPRNYLRVPDARARPDAVRPRDVVEALRAHRAFLTTAPFVKLGVDGGEIGDTVDARAGKVNLDLTVEAAPWVAVSQVTVYVDGEVYRRIPVPASTERRRVETAIPIALPPGGRDGFLVVRVDGDRPMQPVVGAEADFEVWPFALTNPVFLDRDGNGRYDAPAR